MKPYLETLDRPVLTISPAGMSPEVDRMIGPAGRHCRERARKIIRGVANHWGMSVAEMLSHSRIRRICWPRQVAMFLVRRATTMSTTELGKLFHRDSTAIVHATQTVTDLMQCYPQVREEIGEIERKVAV
jgi:chromosomal replication initiation ATPase DnaA